jgi:hypothetical protein
MTWGIVHGKGYLLCFDVPFGTVRPGKTPEEARHAGLFGFAEHYLGISDDVPARLTEHETGRGAVVTGHVRKAGIGWELVRIWEDINRDEERRLKENPAGRWCPRHGVERVMSRDPVYAAVMDRARANFRLALDVARMQGLHASSDDPALAKRWYQAARAAQAELRATRQQAARDWVGAHPRSRLRHVALECVTNGMPIITPPNSGTAARRRAAAAEVLTRPPDARGEPDDPWDPKPAGDRVPEGSGEIDDPWDPQPPGDPDIEAA